LQCFSVESVRDMAGGVCKLCHGNGSTEHRVAVCHIFLR